MGQIILLASIFLLTVAVGISEGQDYVVNAGPLGKIRGGPATTMINKKPYVRFYGIPYAKGPTGESRFLPAEPMPIPLVENGEIFDARQEGNSCIQPDGFSIFNTESRNMSLEFIAGNTDTYKEYENSRKRQGTMAYLGNEDCLNLNIYTPKVYKETFTIPEGTGSKLLPVIVFFHGGAFSSGNGFFYSPSKFLENHEVILVTFNYRLGVLGFYSLNTNDVPGNAALYDMISALQWVQNYIRHWGGDPDNVTIMGQSAGAAAISHLMLSEMSIHPKRLFHRAIAQSGSSLNDWATTTNPVPANLRIAELSECYHPLTDLNQAEQPDLDKITRCMKTVNPNNLVVALERFQAEERQAGRLGFEPVSPVVQKSTWEPKFLRANPIDILEAGNQMKVPLMMGATENDGTFPLGVVYNRFLNCQTCGSLQNNQNFLKNELIPRILRSMGVIDNTQAVYHTLSKKFLGQAAQSGNFTQMIPGLTDLNSVFFFKAGAYRNMVLHSRNNPETYWYGFDHKGQYSLYTLFFPYPPPPIPGGIAHSDDLLYLFHFFTLNAVDQTLSYTMLDYWMNFIHNGNPNIRAPSSRPVDPNVLVWPAFSEGNQEYLIIKPEFAIGNDYMSNWGGNSDQCDVSN